MPFPWRWVEKEVKTGLCTYPAFTFNCVSTECSEATVVKPEVIIIAEIANADNCVFIKFMILEFKNRAWPSQNQ